MMTLRQKVLDYVREAYGTLPERLWKSYPSYEVLRHKALPDEKKAKWYGIIMDVKWPSLGIARDGYADILNVKLDLDTAAFLSQAEGFFPAYHMSKQTGWISILLDGTVPFENIVQQIDCSFALTETGKKKKSVMRTGFYDPGSDADVCFAEIRADYKKRMRAGRGTQEI